jgi:RNA-directed DNA polymerase
VSAVSAGPAAQESAQDSVRALQHALYRAAKADPGRRFHALADKVYRTGAAIHGRLDAGRAGRGIGTRGVE